MLCVIVCCSIWLFCFVLFCLIVLWRKGMEASSRIRAQPLRHRPLLFQESLSAAQAIQCIARRIDQLSPHAGGKLHEKSPVAVPRSPSDLLRSHDHIGMGYQPGGYLRRQPVRRLVARSFGKNVHSLVHCDKGISWAGSSRQLLHVQWGHP